MTYTADFIANLASALALQLKDTEIATCFSQNKEELIIGFAHPDKDFWILADLEPEVSMLYFPSEFHRAKKNSADIFDSIIGLKVLQTVPHENERSFHITLENNKCLLFKLHGKNSNIILIDGVEVIEIFRNNLQNDLKIRLQDLKTGTIKSLLDEDPLLQANSEFNKFKSTYYLRQEKEAILKAIRAKISKTKSYLLKTRQKAKESEEKADYEKIANIIMANVHLKIQNQPSISLYDFYENKDIIIKLKPDLSLQKNAEAYYRKSKNRKIETDMLEKNLKEREDLLQKWEQQIQEIEAIEDVKTLRNYAKANRLVTEKSAEEKVIPFHVFELDSFQIWVGKNSQNNDLLTLKYAFKEDLWLHAKDVPGSHVIIKYQSGKTFPKNVIERAAQLAAANSKRKNDSLVPVTVTTKKYVRKPKGLLPGQVMVEREDVVLVQPII